MMSFNFYYDNKTRELYIIVNDEVVDILQDVDEELRADVFLGYIYHKFEIDLTDTGDFEVQKK